MHRHPLTHKLSLVFSLARRAHRYLYLFPYTTLFRSEEIKLWKWFREVSLQEFNRIYKELGITFDSYNGEAFFNDKMQPVVDELKEKGLLEESRGAQVVNLGEDENPALILKSDGSSLYMTRDLA